ncbi:MAG: hypothetical protein KDA51_13725 [Planctomycetales bacterium]|jgi:hypothetical protein|nr:hypothetical protein [Planctomycetales bacterium]
MKTTSNYYESKTTMLSRRMIVALAACAILSSSTAFAGGGNGGSKADPIINVRNDSSAQIAAFINPDPAKIAALPANPTQAQIEAAGGKVINPGKTQKFTVKQGTYIVAAGVNVNTAPQVQVTTAMGKVYNYAYTNANTLVKF